MNTTTGPTTGPTPALPDFLTLFAAMHDAMRRDVSRLDRAVARLAGPGDARALHAWWQRFADVIVEHHHREDEILWPALEERCSSFAADRVPLDDDHADLDRLIARVDAALAMSGDDRVNTDAARHDAVDAVAAFRLHLVDHLAREEALAFPLLAEHFDVDEYAELEKEIGRRSSLRSTVFELPWVLDEAGPKARAMVNEVLPAPVRLLLRCSWQRRYERMAAIVREVAR